MDKERQGKANSITMDLWNMLSEHNIVGRAVAVWLHKKPGLRLPEFSRNGWIQ